MRLRELASSAWLCWLGACAATPAPGPSLALPARQSAIPGSELATAWATLPLAAREAAIAAQFDLGNVPSFLARLAPVELRAVVDGRERTATVWCAPDVFGLGTDDDWLRLPLTPGLAQRFADRLDCVLPTRRIVDAIWQQAAVRLVPQPFHPREHDIASLPVFAASHAAIEEQLAGRPRPALVAGHKKDVVISALLRDWPDRVVIYGWHRPDGTAIQPLSKVHTTAHVDYSHGIRFVAKAMLVDGRPTTVDAVLADPELHVLLSDEGPVACWRYRT
jgi:hypothetical protein